MRLARGICTVLDDILQFASEWRRTGVRTGYMSCPVEIKYQVDEMAESFFFRNM